MSYLVLARKYRPQTFAEMVGQEHVTRTLGNALASGRIHHAFLFTGARGVGKTTAARILARSLCCERGVRAEPCGECDACREIVAGTAVDVVEMDGASNRGIDDVRTLREAVRYQPARLRRKVIIVDEVHMLTTEAFNALLKTLEEPPPHVTFVFATTEPHKIPITILSRCQRYDFSLIPTERLAKHLAEVLGKEEIVAEEAACALLAREAAGSARDALSLCDQVVAFGGQGAKITVELVVAATGATDRGLIAELIGAIVDKRADQALTILGRAQGAGQEPGQLSRAVLSLLRDLAVWKVTSPSAPGEKDGPGASRLFDLSDGERTSLVALAERVSAAMAHSYLESFARAVEEILRAPAPWIRLELALLDLVHLAPLESLAALVARLESLEARLAAGGDAAPAGSGSRSSGGAASTPAATPRPPSGRSAAAFVPGSGSGATAAMGAPAASVSSPRSPLAGSAAPGQSASRGPGRADGAAQSSTATDHGAADLASVTTVNRWEDFLAGMEANSPAIFATLALARPVTFGVEGVRLAFDSGCLDLAKSRQSDIEQWLARAFGQAKIPVAFERAVVRPGEPTMAEAGAAAPGRSAGLTANARAGALSYDEQQQAAVEADRRARKQEAMSHPATKHVLETFTGSAVETVRVQAASPSPSPSPFAGTDVDLDAVAATD